MNAYEKLYEALEEADTVLSGIGYDSETPIRRLIKSALSEPARNCDKGTVDEQFLRWENECKETKCDNCEFQVFESWSACFAHWSQKPYKSCK